MKILHLFFIDFSSNWIFLARMLVFVLLKSLIFPIFVQAEDWDLVEDPKILKAHHCCLSYLHLCLQYFHAFWISSFLAQQEKVFITLFFLLQVSFILPKYLNLNPVFQAIFLEFRHRETNHCSYFHSHLFCLLKAGFSLN